MIDKLKSIFAVSELRNRILFTLAILAVYRVGSVIPTPGINTEALAILADQTAGTMFGLYNMFSGGNLSRVTIFALGIMPYISASIIIQLLTVVWPYLERLKNEGELGRRKITQYTRYGTLLLCIVQALAIALFLERQTNIAGGLPLVYEGGWSFRLLTVLTLTTGTIFIMWLGEQITERGIGNGMSLIIFAGIVVGLPQAVITTVDQLRTGQIGLFRLIALLALMILVIAAVVFIERGHRRVVVQYAKRVVGRKVFGGQSSFLPLKVNYAGVMPVIFASAILMFPAQLLRTLGAAIADSATESNWALDLAAMFAGRGWLYYLVYAGLIMVFSYFWVSIMFKPVQIADDLKKNGGYVPGVRPGDPTARFLDFVMTRLTLAGSIFLTLIAVFPDIIFNFAGVSYNVATFFGGTGLLIIVGVVLDTMRQIETFLLQRHYDGFLRKGRLRGRSSAPQGQGIESLELKEFEAQWRPLIWISVALFLVGLAGWVLKP